MRLAGASPVRSNCRTVRFGAARVPVPPVIEITCNKCSERFQCDPAVHLTPEHEVVKFSQAAPKSWIILVPCPKCGHRLLVEVAEGNA